MADEFSFDDLLFLMVPHVGNDANELMLGEMNAAEDAAYADEEGESSNDLADVAKQICFVATEAITPIY